MGNHLSRLGYCGRYRTSHEKIFITKIGRDYCDRCFGNPGNVLRVFGIGDVPQYSSLTEHCDKQTSVSITFRTASGSETAMYDEILLGHTITIRKNTSDLIIESFDGDSSHGIINLPVSKTIRRPRNYGLACEPIVHTIEPGLVFW